MTMLLKLLKFNDVTASTIGLLANGLLIYLIFTLNKENMKQISRTLLQNCVLDALLAVIILLAQPQIIVIEGIYFNIISSPLYVLGFPFASFMICTFGTSLHLAILAMPVPFYVRYLVVCKNVHITFQDVIKPYLLVFGYIIPLYGLCFWCCPMFSDEYVKYRRLLTSNFWLDEYEAGPTFIAVSVGNLRLYVVFSVMLFGTLTSYILVIYFSLKITKHLRQNSLDMSKRTQTLNNQLQLTLVIQAIGPLITANFPTACLILMVFLKYENYYISLICCSLLGWISVINPIAAMLIITPYRKKIKSFFRMRRSQTIVTDGKVGSLSQPSNPL